MQSQSRLLEDLAKVASSAMGVAAGMREEVEARLRDQFEKILGRMDLVTRAEFEVVQAMAQKAREEQLALAARLDALEAKIAPAKKASKPRATKKAATKKAAAKKATPKKAAPKS